MGYITAIEASRRIGVGERTVRLWISKGKLKAEKIAVNRLAIDEEDVDRIAKYRSKYGDSRKERYESDIYERFSELERQMTELGRQVAELANRVVVIEGQKQHEKAEKVPVSRGVVPGGDGLPNGSIYARDFAVQHGVSESSFRRHINAGIGGDVVEAEKTTKGRYLTPSQQIAALEFWHRHGVKYTP